MLITKDAALKEVQRDQRLTEIHKAEPTRLEQVIDLALMQPLSVNGWVVYSRLKSMASRFVGWNAENVDLKTAEHYKAMIDFLCFLVPDEMNGNEEPVGLPESLRNRGVRSLSDATQDFMEQLKARMEAKKRARLIESLKSTGNKDNDVA